MRIILTQEENEARLHYPNGAVVVTIRRTYELARVQAYADVSGTGALEKTEWEIPVEVEAVAPQPSAFLLGGSRSIRLRDRGSD
jgi:hypothetical protein